MASEAVATIVLNERGEVLVLKRGATAPWMPGMWNLPGGAVDPGERPVDAARREAMEEAAIQLGELREVDRSTWSWGQLTVFCAIDWSGDPEHNWESSEMRWVSLPEASRLPLVPGLRGPLLDLWEQVRPRSRRSR